MSLKESAIIGLDYPIQDAKFIDNKTIIAIGGGGEGNNGVPNKITAVRCSFKAKDPSRKLQKFREITLPSNEDSPQCLDIANISGDDENKFSVFIGCNQSSQLIKSMNINNNLRKYVYTNDEHLRFLDAAQLEQNLSGDVDDYPKIIRLSSNNSIGCLMTAAFPSMIYIFNPETLDLNFRYKPSVDVEIKDYCLSPDDDGKVLCYITGNSIETVSTVTGNSISSSNNNQENKKELSGFILSKVKFIDNENVIVTATSRKDKSISILQYSINKMKLIKQRVVTKKFNAVVALDISINQDLICIAGNDFSVSIIKLSTLKTIKVFKKLHSFAITSVSFSPNGSKLATCSAAKSLQVFKIPINYSKSKSLVGTLFQYFISMVFVVLLSILIQKGYENGQLFEYYELSRHYGKVGFDFTNKYGQMGVAFIREKLQQNIEETGKDKQYFQETEWDTTTQDDVVSSNYIDTTIISTTHSTKVQGSGSSISEKPTVTSKTQTKLNNNEKKSSTKKSHLNKALKKKSYITKKTSDIIENSKVQEEIDYSHISSTTSKPNTISLSKKKSQSNKTKKVQKKPLITTTENIPKSTDISVESRKEKSTVLSKSVGYRENIQTDTIHKKVRDKRYSQNSEIETPVQLATDEKSEDAIEGLIEPADQEYTENTEKATKFVEEVVNDIEDAVNDFEDVVEEHYEEPYEQESTDVEDVEQESAKQEPVDDIEETVNDFEDFEQESAKQEPVDDLEESVNDLEDAVNDFEDGVEEPYEEPYGQESTDDVEETNQESTEQKSAEDPIGDVEKIVDDADNDLEDTVEEPSEQESTDDIEQDIEEPSEQESAEEPVNDLEESVNDLEDAVNDFEDGVEEPYEEPYGQESTDDIEDTNQESAEDLTNDVEEAIEKSAEDLTNDVEEVIEESPKEFSEQEHINNVEDAIHDVENLTGIEEVAEEFVEQPVEQDSLGKLSEHYFDHVTDINVEETPEKTPNEENIIEHVLGNISEKFAEKPIEGEYFDEQINEASVISKSSELSFGTNSVTEDDSIESVDENIKENDENIKENDENIKENDEDPVIYNHNLGKIINNHKFEPDYEPVDLGTESFQESVDESKNNDDVLDEITRNTKNNAGVNYKAPKSTTKAKIDNHDEL